MNHVTRFAIAAALAIAFVVLVAIDDLARTVPAPFAAAVGVLLVCDLIRDLKGQRDG